MRGAESRDVGSQRVPRLGIAEEFRDVDRERVEQLLILARVRIEQLAVILIRMDAAGAHAHGDPPPQTFVLVGFAAQAARFGDFLRERLKATLVGVRTTRRHDNVLRVSRFALTSSCLGLSSSARRQSSLAWSRSFRLYAMLPSLK